ncbi:MAG: aminoacyl-tRNA hydrolase [Elusimicrobia bacterium]|nr:aminoacyl-tRNA hydrolase [Elusimicrobiota bacterium]
MRLVVGLGNPGERYARTRHNVGFRFVERLADDAPWKDFRGLGRFARTDALLLAEPLTFMNESGSFVQSFAAFHKIEPREILVCYDDVALALGRLKVRPSGSSGGQKGMLSIIDTLGTEEIPRLRLGIGPQPAGWDSADFVLSRFGAAEEKALPEILDRAAQAVNLVLNEGIAAAMNRFNPAPAES